MSTEQSVLWGAEAISRVVGKSVKATFHLLASRRLPARKVGKQWVANRDQLREFLRGPDEHDGDGKS